ncbi:hypothetical protein pb186bvf_003842 [Paramecium bursaria]
MLKQTQVTQFFDRVQKKVKIQRSVEKIEKNQDSCISLTGTTTPQKKNIDDWIVKKNSSKNWPYLPKMFMYQIFRFLQLKDCFICALVCRFWKLCYHNIYFSYNFFKEFSISNYNEQELSAVLRRASPDMKHIKKFREIFKGQKLGAILQKTNLETTLSSEYNKTGQLIESFKLEPKRQQSSVFLTDKDIQSILSGSHISLQFMQLVSCQFMTGKGFEHLKSCTFLTHLNITNNQNIQDKNLSQILPKLKQLQTLILVQLQQVTEEVFLSIRGLTKLDRLDLSYNPQIQFNNITILKVLKISSLGLKDNFLDNDQLRLIVECLPSITSLNLQGCLFVNSYSLHLLRNLCLKRLNISKIHLSPEDIESLVKDNQSLYQVIANNNILNDRVYQILQQRINN